MSAAVGDEDDIPFFCGCGVNPAGDDARSAQYEVIHDGPFEGRQVEACRPGKEGVAVKDSLGSQKSGQTSISHGNSGLLVIERGESVIDHPISLWDAETVFDRKDVQIMTSQSSHNRVVKSRAASAPASAVAPSDQMKIAVVGASGRIGRLVVDHLLSSGHSVVPVSRTAPPSARATHTPVNVLDSDAVHHLSLIHI